jgi:hypothetical protein
LVGDTLQFYLGALTLGTLFGQRHLYDPVYMLGLWAVRLCAIGLTRLAACAPGWCPGLLLFGRAIGTRERRRLAFGCASQLLVTRLEPLYLLLKTLVLGLKPGDLFSVERDLVTQERHQPLWVDNLPAGGNRRSRLQRWCWLLRDTHAHRP